MLRHVVLLFTVGICVFAGVVSAEGRWRMARQASSKPEFQLSGDTTAFTGAAVNPLDTLESFLLGALPNETEVKIIAATLGSVVVYVFSYLFMGAVFIGYLMGVIVLLCLKIMFTGFIPAQVVSYDSQPTARVLEPYAGGKNINYENSDLNIYDKTMALVNRGYATGLYLYDVFSTPECQKYIVCQASATFADEDANEITFKDMLRQASHTVEQRSGRQGFARAVSIGALTRKCDDAAMACPSLSPAFLKMNELLNYFGVKQEPKE